MARELILAGPSTVCEQYTTQNRHTEHEKSCHTDKIETTQGLYRTDQTDVQGEVGVLHGRQYQRLLTDRGDREQTAVPYLPQQQIIVVCCRRFSAMEFPVGGLSRWH